MSPETLDLFDELLNGVSVPAAAPNFDDLCARVSKAKRELAEARADADAVAALGE